MQTTDEADHHLWVRPGELEKINLLSSHLERIQDALLEKTETIVKEQRKA